MTQLAQDQPRHDRDQDQQRPRAATRHVLREELQHLQDRLRAVRPDPVHADQERSPLNRVPVTLLQVLGVDLLGVVIVQRQHPDAHRQEGDAEQDDRPQADLEARQLVTFRPGSVEDEVQTDQRRQTETDADAGLFPRLLARPLLAKDQLGDLLRHLQLVHQILPLLCRQMSCKVCYPPA